MLKAIHIRTKESSAFYNITSYVRQAVIESGVNEGIAVVYCPHTTAGITINENADPDVVEDLFPTDHSSSTQRAILMRI